MSTQTQGRVLHLKFLAATLCGLLAVSLVVAPQCDDDSATTPEILESTLDAEERTVAYRWYDLFNIPYGEWWDYRVEWYGILDIPTTGSYPYLNRHFYNETSFDTFSGARLNVTARSLPEINMNERPVFLPLLSGEDNPGGGNAVIDWYMQYLTEQEYVDRGYPAPCCPFMDGWVVSLNGTVRLDEAGAISVMGITSEDYHDFETWLAGNSSDFEMDYVDWLMDEGNERLDIYCMYDYEYVPLYIGIAPEKVGEEIVLTFDAIGWGIEALMTRWLEDAFMPTEWWFEDFAMHAEMGPDSADIDIDTAVVYALRASESKERGDPCWVWQGMLQDHIDSFPGHYSSDFDPYSDKSLLCQSPGSGAYGTMVPYTYTPGCFNLSEGESLAFCWPSDDILFLGHVDTMVTDNATAPAIISYSEPLPSEEEDWIDYSPAYRSITFNGPVDFWTWSLAQDAHENLSAEWDRIGLLPYGMPYVELSNWGPDTPPLACLEAEHAPDATSASQYLLNASRSSDSEDDLEDLRFRWDLDGDGVMDTGWDSEPTIERDFGGVGTFEVSVAVLDTDDMTATASTVVTVIEVDPPSTAMSVEGTAGLSGWFVTDVVVTLSSEDQSGIRATYYRMGEGSWSEYVGAIDIGSSGAWNLSYYSIDVEGNVEPQQNGTVKVDLDPPVAIIHDVYFNAESPEDVEVRWLYLDHASGVNRSEVSLDGGERISVGMDTSYSYSNLSEGNHTFELVVYDNAGLSTTVTRTFTISSEGDSGILLYIGAVVAVAVVVAVAALLLLRRRQHAA